MGTIASIRHRNTDTSIIIQAVETSSHSYIRRHKHRHSNKRAHAYHEDTYKRTHEVHIRTQLHTARAHLGSEQRRLQPVRIARAQLQRETPQLIGAETLKRGR